MLNSIAIALLITLFLFAVIYEYARFKEMQRFYPDLTISQYMLIGDKMRIMNEDSN
jgi:hypothetical protein